MNNKVSIIGASGHAKVVLEIIQKSGLLIDQIFDADNNRENFMGYKVNHDFSSIKTNTIVAIGNNKIRKSIVEQYQLQIDAIIHPASNISSYCNIGKGTVVMPGVSINADAVIGNHCILNTNCSIDHDCEIQDFVHISPNASLAGNVSVGEGTHIGIGACIIQGIKIGSNCIIGAGSVVIRDIPDNSMLVGNPGKIIKNISES